MIRDKHEENDIIWKYGSIHYDHAMRMRALRKKQKYINLIKISITIVVLLILLVLGLALIIGLIYG